MVFDARNLIKGRIAETVFAQMFREREKVLVRRGGKKIIVEDWGE